MEALPNRDLPIVLLNIFEAMPIIHYAPAELASRLIYVAPGTQSLFQGYVNMLRICPAPGRAQSMSDFLAAHDTFLVYIDSRTLYQLDDFIRKGADVRIESASGEYLADSLLVSVTFRKNQKEPAAAESK